MPISALVFLTQCIIVFPWSAVFSFGCCCWKILGLRKPDRRSCGHPLSSCSDKQFSIHSSQKILHMQGIYFLLSVRRSIDFSNTVGKCCLSFREKQNFVMLPVFFFSFLVTFYFLYFPSCDQKTVISCHSVIPGNTKKALRSRKQHKQQNNLKSGWLERRLILFRERRFNKFSSHSSG